MVELNIPAETESKVKRIAETYFKDYRLPSLGIAIVSAGAIRRFYPLPVDSITPIETGHAFPIGSITKSFAAAAVLALRDKGLLSLEDSPQVYVPELREFPFWESVTLRHLLSMQSGLAADHAGSWAEQHLQLDNDELSLQFRQVPIPVCSPGERFNYSNFGFMVLGRVISAAAGLDAREFITRNFLTPLRLYHSSWSPPDPSRRIVGYIYRGSALVEDEIFTAGSDGSVFGGLWSTLEDVAGWMSFLQCIDPSEQNLAVLSKSSRAELVKAHALCPPSLDGDRLDCNAYALGMKHYAVAGEWQIGVSGAVPGFGCHFRWSPRTQLGVVAVGTIRYAPVWNFCGEILKLISDASSIGHVDVHPKLHDRIQTVLGLIRKWDDSIVEGAFTESLFLDQPREVVKAGFESLARVVSKHGSLDVLSSEGLEACLGCNGVPHLEVAISPIEPGRIQSLVFLTL